VKVTAEPLALAAGQPLKIHARALRAKKPVFIDIHAGDGAWIDTLSPVIVSEPPRDWSTALQQPGFLQVEAYQFTTSPGESAALARVQVTDGAPDSDASLAPLIAQQRALLELGRTEKGFDRELERAYLDAVEKADVAAADVPLARAWLLGTLPVEVLGPPLALTTQVREQEALVAAQAAVGARAEVVPARRGRAVPRGRHDAGGDQPPTCRGAHVTGDPRRGRDRGDCPGDRQAQRAVLLRAVALVVTMALGLVLTVVVLDKLLWQT
jgi:hypothetical protein